MVHSKVVRLLRRLIPQRLHPTVYLVRLAQQRTGTKVIGGPFDGMRYVADAVGSALIPKLLGIYERELAAKIEAICVQGPSLIVDVGAAEGYYAVGLARRNPQARVIAFEMDDRGRRLLTDLARQNFVLERVEIKGRCEPTDLVLALEGADFPVLICDVEGYEDVLLDPVRVPALSRTVMLVETHDFARPGVAERLRQRLEPTHHVEVIWQEARIRQEFPWRTWGTMLLPASYLDWAVSEWRPDRMRWLWMTPRSAATMTEFGSRHAAQSDEWCDSRRERQVGGSEESCLGVHVG
jgi:hypothetical protein